MGSLIDTSILVGAAHVERLDLSGGWAVSVVTVGELQAGVLIAADDTVRARRLALLTAVLTEAPALPIDRSVAGRYGELRAATRREPSNDLWIAATALAHDLTLITADQRQAALPLVRARLAM